jgi:hypothetical protein
MAAFITMTSWQGEFTDACFAQPAPDPATFGMPADDDGTRDDPLLSKNSWAISDYRPDAGPLTAAPTGIVIAVGEESAGTYTARTAVATAALLGQQATVSPATTAASSVASTVTRASTRSSQRGCATCSPPADRRGSAQLASHPSRLLVRTRPQLAVMMGRARLGGHNDRGPLGGNGHAPSTTTNAAFGLVPARSRVVRDPPSIETCAPGTRLWTDQDLRHACRNPPGVAESSNRGFGPARSRRSPPRGAATPGAAWCCSPPGAVAGIRG